MENKIAITDIINICNNELGFRLNESDAHDVVNYLNFVQGWFYKIVKYRSDYGLYATLKNSYTHPDVDIYKDNVKSYKTRQLFTNRWLSADIKRVSDGSLERDTNYISGWHLFSDYSQCKLYFERFKNKEDLKIIRVRACGLKRKEHSRSDVWLAEQIFIPSNQD